MSDPFLEEPEDDPPIVSGWRFLDRAIDAALLRIAEWLHSGRDDVSGDE